jgi:hypothetical protein
MAGSRRDGSAGLARSSCPADLRSACQKTSWYSSPQVTQHRKPTLGIFCACASAGIEESRRPTTTPAASGQPTAKPLTRLMHSSRLNLNFSTAMMGSKYQMLSLGASQLYRHGAETSDGNCRITCKLRAGRGRTISESRRSQRDGVCL